LTCLFIDWRLFIHWWLFEKCWLSLIYDWYKCILKWLVITLVMACRAIVYCDNGVNAEIYTFSQSSVYYISTIYNVLRNEAFWLFCQKPGYTSSQSFCLCVCRLCGLCVMKYFCQSANLNRIQPNDVSGGQCQLINVAYSEAIFIYSVAVSSLYGRIENIRRNGVAVSWRRESGRNITHGYS